MRGIWAVLFSIAWTSVATAADAVTQNFDDPIAYCAAAGTVDVPGKHYVGQPVPDRLVEALGEGADTEGTVWRCENGQVAFCYPFTKNQSCTKDVSLPGRDAAGYLVSSWQFLGTPAPAAAAPIDATGSAQALFDKVNDGSSTIRYTCDGSGWPSMSSDGNHSTGGHYGVTTAWVVFIVSRGKIDEHAFQSDLNIRNFAEVVYGNLKTACNDKISTSNIVIEFNVNTENGEKSFSALSVDGKSWEIVRNSIADWVVQEDERRADELAKQRQQVAVAAAQAEQQRQYQQEMAESRQKLKALGVAELTELSGLVINPFVYENQIVGVPVIFDRMISNSEGLFYDASHRQWLDVTNLPATMLRGHFTVVVVMKGSGLRDVPGVGNLPSGQMVAVLGCRDENCSLVNDPF